MTGRAFLGAVVGAAALLAVAGCSGGSEPDVIVSQPAATEEEESTTPTPTAEPEPNAAGGALLLRFSEATRDGIPPTFENSGRAPLKTKTVSWGTGEIGPAASPEGRGVRLPAFDEEESGFAMLSVVNNADDEDPLSPGDAAFSFGVDFRLDKVTTGTASDDGDNVIQRGLFEGSSQYKIQIDDGRPSCRVRGLTGEVIVTARRRVEPDTWYRTRCTRRDSTVTLQLGEIPADGGPIDWTSASDTAPIGSVIMPSHTPLSVGGKLAADGTILPSSTDQFNGAVDRVFYTLTP